MAAVLRVGAVNYLNAKPLIEGLDFPSLRLVQDVPSRLADAMAAGQLDVGLLPVIEYFRGERYRYLPHIAIASYGPVLSVTLFSNRPWRSIRRVAVDAGSRTSAALVRIMLELRYGVIAQYVPLPLDAPAEEADADAVLLIGDRAMRACLPGFRYAFDLGIEWTEWTGLPMVYAVWAVRPNVDVSTHASAFYRAKQQGLDNVAAIALREAQRLGLDAGYCRRYLTHIIRYDLGPAERAGMQRFWELAAQLRLAPPPVALRQLHAGIT